jgi:hypothetical protein
MSYALIGIVAAAVVAWLVLRRRHGSAAPAASAGEESEGVAAAESTEFHAVSIKPGFHRCNSVKKLDGVRIMSADAPPLPLPDCDIEECSCRYVHHEDRRVDGDRRIPFPVGGAWQRIGDPDKDQRTGNDRRQADVDDAD